MTDNKQQLPYSVEITIRSLIKEEEFISKISDILKDVTMEEDQIQLHLKETKQIKFYDDIDIFEYTVSLSTTKLPTIPFINVIQKKLKHIYYFSLNESIRISTNNNQQQQQIINISEPIYIKYIETDDNTLKVIINADINISMLNKPPMSFGCDIDDD